MIHRYTSYQVPRSARADAEDNKTFYLFKNVTSLRLTYQIRVLTFMARDHGRKFVIRVPTNCEVAFTLKAFQKEHSEIVRIEKV